MKIIKKVKAPKGFSFFGSKVKNGGRTLQLKLVKDNIIRKMKNAPFSKETKILEKKLMSNRENEIKKFKKIIIPKGKRVLTMSLIKESFKSAFGKLRKEFIYEIK